MKNQRAAPLVRLGGWLIRWTALLAVALSGVVLADPPSSQWRDGVDRGARPDRGGVQPYSVPRRYDGDARADRAPRQRSQQPTRQLHHPRQDTGPAGRYRGQNDSYQRPDDRGTYQRSLPAPRLHAPAPRRGVNDVIDMVERRYGGKVVGVDDADGHYRVRLLQRDGRVRTLQVPLDGY